MQVEIFLKLRVHCITKIAIICNTFVAIESSLERKKSLSNPRNDDHKQAGLENFLLMIYVLSNLPLITFKIALPILRILSYPILITPESPSSQVVIQLRFAGQLIILIGFSNPRVYVDRIATMIIDTIVPIRKIILLCVRRKSVSEFAKVKQCMYFLDANFWLVFL